jgi:hypothetical protein
MAIVCAVPSLKLKTRTVKRDEEVPEYHSWPENIKRAHMQWGYVRDTEDPKKKPYRAPTVVRRVDTPVGIETEVENPLATAGRVSSAPAEGETPFNATVSSAPVEDTSESPADSAPTKVDETPTAQPVAAPAEDEETDEDEPDEAPKVGPATATQKSAVMASGKKSGGYDKKNKKRR